MKEPLGLKPDSFRKGMVTVCQSSICPDPVRFPALGQIKPHAPRACGALPSIPLSFTRANILPQEGRVLNISVVSACLQRTLHRVQCSVETYNTAIAAKQNPV